MNDKPWADLSDQEKVARAEEVLGTLERRASELAQSRCGLCPQVGAGRCEVCYARHEIGGDLLRLH